MSYYWYIPCWYTRYTHSLSMHLPPVDAPAPCQYIHLPPVNMPTVLSIRLPCCQYTHPAVDTVTSCRYTHCVVNTPTLLSIHLLCCRYTCLLSIRPPCSHYTHLLLIHLWPYWYTCGPIDTPALAVIVVGCGAADDVAGSVDAHIPQGGEGQEMMSRWWWWSTCLAWRKVHIHQLCPGWNLQVVGGTMALGNCIVTQVTRVTLSHNTLN